jgi:hypothetical protein
LRENLNTAIDIVSNREDGAEKLKALKGLYDIVEEYTYELELLLGEQFALEEINNNKQGK